LAASFISVPHRALPDLQRMKLPLFCGRVVGTEVGIPWCEQARFLVGPGVPGAPQTVATGLHRPRSTLLRFLIYGTPRRRRNPRPKLMDNPMHRPETETVSQFARCGAKTRSGAPCKSAPVTGRRRCRMQVVRTGVAPRAVRETATTSTAGTPRRWLPPAGGYVRQFIRSTS
jgi:hypothetical protein